MATDNSQDSYTYYDTNQDDNEDLNDNNNNKDNNPVQSESDHIDPEDNPENA